MSAQARPTPGGWKFVSNQSGFENPRHNTSDCLVLWIGSDSEKVVCAVVCKDNDADESAFLANAVLIAEAGTVLHETGRTPRQLVDERAELLAALRELLAVAPAKPPGAGIIVGIEDRHRAAINAARAAIAKEDGA